MSTTPEATRILHNLAGNPHHVATANKAVTQEILMCGNILSCGHLYNITAKDIGADIFRISLELANP